MTHTATPAGGLATPGTDDHLTTGNTPNHTAAAESWRALIDDGKPAPPDVGCLECGAALTWITICEPCERRAFTATFAGNGGAR